jgi:signal transduction histidine kinase
LDKGESMIRNILNIEKDEINTRSINLEETDLIDLLKGVLEDHSVNAEKKNLHLHFSHAENPGMVLTDSQLLKRVFDNLLSNAIKFSEPGKNIFVDLTEKGKMILISVRDEGPGIPVEEMKTLFSKYGKTSTRPTGGESSTGLGLSIVKRIMQELNGDVRCESTVGTGSVFTITLNR